MLLKILVLAILSLTFLSSRAEPISQDPHPQILRVMTYNTWYVFAKGKAEDLGKQWIASQSPDIVALQELTSIQPEKLEQLSASWHHSHSSLLKTQGFSVGLTSRFPITVIEKKVKGMHHGFLHAKVQGLHFFVIHLSPFDWRFRSQEAQTLLGKINPLLQSGQQVIVLGDFNASCSSDKKWLDQNTELLNKTAESDHTHAHHQNLKEGKFDYSVMEQFFNAGLIDTTLSFLPDDPSQRLSFPSGILGGKKSAPERGERIDFILSSKKLAQRVHHSKIVTKGIVNQISDHFPVITDFQQPFAQ